MDLNWDRRLDRIVDRIVNRIEDWTVDRIVEEIRYRTTALNKGNFPVDESRKFTNIAPKVGLKPPQMDQNGSKSKAGGLRGRPCVPRGRLRETERSQESHREAQERREWMPRIPQEEYSGAHPTSAKMEV